MTRELFLLIIIFILINLVLVLIWRLWKLKELSERDHLTGLFNRNVFDGTLLNLLHLQKGRRDFALLVLDIDFFKAVNDNEGHLVGDKILKAVAVRIMGNIRPSDMAFRYGGEEFAVILPGTGRESAIQVGKRLLEKMRMPFRLEKTTSGDNTLNVTVSIGVAISKEGDSPPSVFSRADEALYHAKESGRDRLMVKNNRSK